MKLNGIYLSISKWILVWTSHYPTHNYGEIFDNANHSHLQKDSPKLQIENSSFYVLFVKHIKKTLSYNFRSLL